MTGVASEPQAPSLVEAAEELLARRRARRSLLAFIQYVWWQPEPLVIGLHTRMICERIDRAIEDFENGKSTFLKIKVPFRHGKSDIISRALPPFFLGRCADKQPEIISTGYGATLVSKFSSKARSIVESAAYQRLFPGIKPSKTKWTDAEWRVQVGNNEDGWRESAGQVSAQGLGGSLTGTGYHLGLLDDYCKSRAEAESLTYREKAWDHFSEGFLTRRAPISITIVTATPWHTDDVMGRITKRMEEDDFFPYFEDMTFPAKGGAVVNGERIPYAKIYLFEERFSVEWYLGHYATLGSYAASGLLNCNPTSEAGNFIDISHIQYHDDPKEFPAVLYTRFWDVASTLKQVSKADPDYTVGALIGITREGELPHIWIKDIVAGQWNPTLRNEKIKGVAVRDGAGVPIVVESNGVGKETLDTMKEILRGVRSVAGVTMATDKAVRAQPLVPIFEAGNAHVVRAEWNDLFLIQFREFPNGSHDDCVDAVSGAFNYAWARVSLDKIRPGDSSRRESIRVTVGY
jgi:predicted phage terminase large subunit-like protein